MNINNFFQSLDLDIKGITTIVKMKLLIDYREVSLYKYMNNKKYINSKKINKFKLMLVQNLVLGLLYSIFFPINNYIKFSGLLLTFLSLLIVMTILSNSTILLPNPRDITNILSKGINLKTLKTANVIHMTYYLLSNSIMFILIPIIIIGIKENIIVSIIILFEVVLINISLIFGILALYNILFLICKFSLLQKLFDFFQIIMGIIIFLFLEISYYNYENWNILKLGHNYFNLLNPLVCNTSLLYILNKHYNKLYILGVLCVLFTPIIIIIIYIYTNKLTSIEIIEFEQSQKKKNSIWKEKFKKIICSNSEEITFFNFTIKILKNSRTFKMKAYPLIGQALILPFIFILITRKLRFPHDYLIVSFYFVTLFSISTAHFLKYSPNYEASWIYDVIPTVNIKNLFYGTLKAFLIRIVVPTSSIAVISIFVIFGFNIFTIYNSIIFILITLAITPILYKLELGKEIPFTLSADEITFVNIKRFFGMFLLIIISVFQILSELLFKQKGLIIFILISVIFCILSWIKEFNNKKFYIN